MGIESFGGADGQRVRERRDARVNCGREGRARLEVMSKFLGENKLFWCQGLAAWRLKGCCQAVESLLDIIWMASVEIN